jgi:MFS transporter, FHS family, L-fucose permease
MMIGCLLFYPAAGYEIYGLFLLAFFVLASGITLIQVAANPYVIALGPEKTAASRITFAQALNSLVTTVAPIFGAFFILDTLLVYASAIQRPYLIIAGTLFIAAIIFSKIKLPVFKHVESNPKKMKAVFGHVNHFCEGRLRYSYM